MCVEHVYMYVEWGGGGGVGKLGERGQKVQTSSYEISKLWDVMYRWCL